MATNRLLHSMASESWWPKLHHSEINEPRGKEGGSRCRRRRLRWRLKLATASFIPNQLQVVDCTYLQCMRVPACIESGGGIFSPGFAWHRDPYLCQWVDVQRWPAIAIEAPSMPKQKWVPLDAAPRLIYTTGPHRRSGLDCLQPWRHESLGSSPMFGCNLWAPGNFVSYNVYFSVANFVVSI